MRDKNSRLPPTGKVMSDWREDRSREKYIERFEERKREERRRRHVWHSGNKRQRSRRHRENLEVQMCSKLRLLNAQCQHQCDSKIAVIATTISSKEKTVSVKCNC